MKKTLNYFQKAIEAISVIFLLLMVLIVFLATVGRYTKLFSIDWSDEFARYSMIIIVYLGLMLASCNGSHFVVEIVPMIFPRKVVKVISVAVTVLVDAFAVFIIKYGWQVCSKMLAQGKLSPMMNLSLGAVYLLIPIGITLMAVFYTIHTLGNLNEEKDEKLEEQKEVET